VRYKKGQPQGIAPTKDVLHSKGKCYISDNWSVQGIQWRWLYRMRINNGILKKSSGYKYSRLIRSKGFVRTKPEIEIRFLKKSDFW